MICGMSHQVQHSSAHGPSIVLTNIVFMVDGKPSTVFIANQLMLGYIYLRMLVSTYMSKHLSW